MTAEQKSCVFRPVSGRVEDAHESVGELEYLGTEGMLIRSKQEFELGTELRRMRIAIDGHPMIFAARGRVTGTLLGMSAIMFLEEPPELRDFLEEQIWED